MQANWRSFTIVALFVAVAYGEEEADIFATLDKDKDGFVSSSEIGKDDKRLFERLLDSHDKNKDGKLSEQEFHDTIADDEKIPFQGGFGGNTPGANGGKLFERFDKNGDGKLSREELPPRLTQKFAQTDLNGDGVISKDEFESGMKSFFEERGKANPQKSKKWLAKGKPSEANQPSDEGQTKTSGDTGGSSIGNLKAALQKFLKRGAEPSLKVSNPSADPAESDALVGAGNESRSKADLLLASIDANHNQILEADEIERAKESILVFDGDKDGKVTMEEILAEALVPKNEVVVSRNDSGASRKGAKLMKRFDKNQDGKVTREEVPAQWAARFDDLDTDRSEDLSLSEIASGKKAFKPKQSNDAP